MRWMIAFMALGGAAAAEPVGITKDMMSVTVETPSGPVAIARIQDNANRLSGDWALTFDGNRPDANSYRLPHGRTALPAVLRGTNGG